MNYVTHVKYWSLVISFLYWQVYRAYCHTV